LATLVHHQFAVANLALDDQAELADQVAEEQDHHLHLEAELVHQAEREEVESDQHL
jgi:hypothetical protein